MEMRDIMFAVGLNVGLLLLFVLLALWWKRRQPMTAVRLRREAQKDVTVTDTPPFEGDFCRMRAMLAVCEDTVAAEKTVAALLIGWQDDGYLTLCSSEKKRLKSFGAEQQATILFPEEPIEPKTQGAESILFLLLRGWIDESRMLQQSEIYNAARANPEQVQGSMDQFVIQGKHLLRSSGSMMPEKKTRHFGFLNEHRALYTPRGVREATMLLGYQKWLGQQDVLEKKKWRDAVLLDAVRGVDAEVLALAQTVAQALIRGANAGMHHKENHRD